MGRAGLGPVPAAHWMELLARGREGHLCACLFMQERWVSTERFPRRQGDLSVPESVLESAPERFGCQLCSREVVRGPGRALQTHAAQAVSLGVPGYWLGVVCPWRRA